MALKMAFDFSAACVLLLALSPLMLALAMIVKATSPGGAIFNQVRIGRGGRPFTLHKFRTMVQDASPPGTSTRILPHDPRITTIGRVLRATSLDELPQLLNILKGEMSFVGPRPDLPHHADRYDEFQRRRLLMRPGITGRAQVSGRNALTWEERIQLDVEYVAGWSLARDFEILVRTPFVVLSGRGVGQPSDPSDPGWHPPNAPIP